MFKKTAITTVLAFASLSASADWYVQPKVGYESRNYEIAFGEGFDPATATIPGLVVGISLINSSGWYAETTLNATTSLFLPVGVLVTA